MEASGKIRRGYFVAGLGALQFAWPGAEDRLRSFREEDPDEERALRILAATDPANPYGAAVPWPDRPEGARPQRGAGARVILHGGELVGFIHKSEESLLTFINADDPGYAEHGDALAEALAARVHAGVRKAQLIAKIDSLPARDHVLRTALEAKGFRSTAKGLMLRAPTRVDARGRRGGTAPPAPWAEPVD